MVAAAASLKAPPKPSIIAFQPRQLMLGKQTMKSQKQKSGKDVICSQERGNIPLLRSIAAYLDTKGFSSTLSALQSEAASEIDGWKEDSIDLENIFHEYLGTSGYPIEEKARDSKEQDSSKKGADQNVIEPVSKKKRKKGNGVDADVETELKRYEDDGNRSAKHIEDSIEKLPTNLVNELHTEKEKWNRDDSKKYKSETENGNLLGEQHGKSKEKKKKGKLVSDSLCENTEQADLEKFQHADEQRGNESQLCESHKKSKDRKKNKNKPSSNSCDENTVCSESEAPVDVAKDIPLDEISAKSKDKKKKKEKSIPVSCVEGIEQAKMEAAENLIEDIPLDEMSAESKDKKKKDRSISVSCNENIEQPKTEAPEGVIKDIPLDETSTRLSDKKTKKKHKTLPTESLVAGDLNQTDSKKEDALVIEEDVIGNEKRSLKKRKRLASEDGEPWTGAETATKEVKLSKMDDSEEKNDKEQLPQANGSLKGDGKKRKVETSEDSPDVSHDITLDKKIEGSQDVKERPSGCDGQKKVNGDIDRSLVKKATAVVPMTKTTKCNDSAEPKTAKAFRRVKVDEVKFRDERLQDNSYWAKDGAGTGYGAKAEEVLGQVRGRDFRHEKTKKKRGSYRGGQIDFQSHSVKFNYSDDE